MTFKNWALPYAPYPPNAAYLSPSSAQLLYTRGWLHKKPESDFGQSCPAAGLARRETLFFRAREFLRSLRAPILPRETLCSQSCTNLMSFCALMRRIGRPSRCLTLAGATAGSVYWSKSENIFCFVEFEGLNWREDSNSRGRVFLTCFLCLFPKLNFALRKLAFCVM